jgi:hypothetical protein
MTKVPFDLDAAASVSLAATRELRNLRKTLEITQQLLHVEQQRVAQLTTVNADLRDRANDTGTKLRRLSVEIAQLKAPK